MLEAFRSPTAESRVLTRIMRDILGGATAAKIPHIVVSSGYIFAIVAHQPVNVGAESLK